MSSTRVLVVEHQSNGGLARFAARMAENGLDTHVVGPDVGVHVPDSLEGYDALVVLGGAMGPTDDTEAPWLPTTRKLLSDAVETQLPTLGICLGAQLLATATGGNVRTMPEGPEIGLHTVTFADDASRDPLFGELAAETVPAIQWHYLEVDLLPQNATAFASSPACNNQAFRVGEAAWGVQFHPEATGDSAASWAEEDRRQVEALGMDPASIVTEVRAADERLGEVWLRVADRFSQIAQQQAARAA